MRILRGFGNLVADRMAIVTMSLVNCDETGAIDLGRTHLDSSPFRGPRRKRSVEQVMFSQAPLQSRTAGFPESGFDLGIASGAFLIGTEA